MNNSLIHSPWKVRHYHGLAIPVELLVFVLMCSSQLSQQSNLTIAAIRMSQIIFQGTPLLNDNATVLDKLEHILRVGGSSGERSFSQPNAVSTMAVRF